jgi:hypothetical protein
VADRGALRRPIQLRRGGSGEQRGLWDRGPHLNGDRRPREPLSPPKASPRVLFARFSTTSDVVAAPRTLIGARSLEPRRTLNCEMIRAAARCSLRLKDGFQSTRPLRCSIGTSLHILASFMFEKRAPSEIERGADIRPVPRSFTTARSLEPRRVQGWTRSPASRVRRQTAGFMRVSAAVICARNTEAVSIDAREGPSPGSWSRAVPTSEGAATMLDVVENRAKRTRGEAFGGERGSRGRRPVFS